MALDPKKITELNQAISLLKKNVSKTSTELAKTCANPSSKFYLQQESVTVGEKTWAVRRLCIKVGENSAIGWVINEDAKCCMECAAAFSLTKWHHHCRKCGNTVCHPCSRRGKEVDSMEALGEVRVCSRCFYKEYGGSMRGSLFEAPELDDDGKSFDDTRNSLYQKCKHHSQLVYQQPTHQLLLHVSPEIRS